MGAVRVTPELPLPSGAFFPEDATSSSPKCRVTMRAPPFVAIVSIGSVCTLGVKDGPGTAQKH